MSKKNNVHICHECEVEFKVSILSKDKKKLPIQICPFCGDSADHINTSPLLKDFDQYDQFNDDEYYSSEDDETDDD